MKKKPPHDPPTTVITVEQARAITGGRTPLVPIEYESALKALQACSTLDEAKYWDNKADALAAWARIYRNDQAGVEARRLKLHAYRRMNELAEELRPSRPNRAAGNPGARSVLMEQGLSTQTTQNVRRIGAIPGKKFEQLVKSPKPPGVTRAALLGIGKSGGFNGFPPQRELSSDAWRTLALQSGTGPSLAAFRSIFCRRYSAKVLARGLKPDEVAGARALITEVQEWLDEFEQHLPREGKKE
jgi:hypothetical protein